MIHLVSKFFLILSLFVVVWSCQAGIDFDAMDSAEKKFQERQRQELIAYMSLETMFPDERVRALAKAAGKGRLKTIDKLIAEGVDVNAQGKGNATPLFWALRNSSKKGFEKLLTLGADPNALLGGSSMMHWVAWHKDVYFLNLSLDHGGDPNLVAGQLKETPLFKAIGIKGNVNEDAVQLLVKAGANVNVKAGSKKIFGMPMGGQTPILHAASIDRFDVVYELLELGADPRLKNDQGTDLSNHIATTRKNVAAGSSLERDINKVVQWLADNAGIDVPAY